MMTPGDDDDQSVLKPSAEQRRSNGEPSSSNPATLSPEEIQQKKMAAQRFRIALQYKQDVRNLPHSLVWM